MADTQTIDEVEALASEFADRFGPPPEQVENLFFQMKIKILATEAGFSSVSVENGQLVLRYPKDVTPDPHQFANPNIRVGKTALWVRLPGDFQTWAQILMEVLTQSGGYPSG
jgi:transcription-repair coupling factor (superfamily II helicase)